MPRKPLDTSIFETITFHIKTPYREVICGSMTESAHLETLTQALLCIDSEEKARAVAEHIVKLQKKLAKCQDQIPVSDSKMTIMQDKK